MVGKWHLSSVRDSSYTYTGAQDTVADCGFDFVEGLYMENFNEDESSYNNYHDGSFSHNMEWVTAEAIDFITEDSVSVLF